MASDLSSRFVEYLRQSKHLTIAEGFDDSVGPGISDRRRAKFWEATDFSPGEFADEAARFFGLGRVTLQDMISAPSLAASFSQRFLREMTVFPYQASDGSAALAVADPTDVATQRAAQIALGARVGIGIATFEDIAVVLNQRLGEDEIDPQVDTPPHAVRSLAQARRPSPCRRTPAKTRQEVSQRAWTHNRTFV